MAGSGVILANTLRDALQKTGVHIGGDFQVVHGRGPSLRPAPLLLGTFPALPDLRGSDLGLRSKEVCAEGGRPTEQCFAYDIQDQTK